LASLSLNHEATAAVPNVLSMLLPMFRSQFEPIISLFKQLIQDPAFIKQIIELLKIVLKTAKSQAREREVAAKKASRQVHNAFCDNCNAKIRGIRYKCLVCDDFDLCETCEQLPNVHNDTHNFVKIRTPVKGCGGGGHSVSSPRVEFLRDVNIEDDSVLEAGQAYAKKWAFRNTGLVSLPQNCKLVQIAGDQLNVTSIEPVSTAQPGQEFEVTVNIIAPEAPGNYKTTWMLVDANDRRFGHPFWIQFSIPTPPEPSKWEQEIATLRDMGFSSIDKDVLEFYLENYKGNMTAVLGSILRQTN